MMLSSINSRCLPVTRNLCFPLLPRSACYFFYQYLPISSGMFATETASAFQTLRSSFLLAGMPALRTTRLPCSRLLAMHSPSPIRPRLRVLAASRSRPALQRKKNISTNRLSPRLGHSQTTATRQKAPFTGENLRRMRSVWKQYSENSKIVKALAAWSTMENSWDSSLATPNISPRFIEWLTINSSVYVSSYLQDANLPGLESAEGRVTLARPEMLHWPEFLFSSFEFPMT